MPLFGNKKKLGEPLRTLTEKEIQNKLYGHLRPEGVLSAGTRQSLSTVKRLAGSEPKAAGPSETSLLDISSGQISQTTSPGQERKDSAAEKNFQNERVSQWLDQENEIAEKKFRGEASFQRKEKGRKEGPASWRETFLPSILSPLLFLLRIAGRLLRILAGVFMRLILSVDLRKPGARRAAYWLAALGSLAGIFAGIHILNVNREAAMKKAPRQSAAAGAAIHKPRLYQPILPSALTAVPIAEPPSSKQESQSAKIEPAPAKGNENKNRSGLEQKKSESGARELSKVNPPDAAAKPLRGESETAAVPAGFVIQVATFAIREDAENLAARLKQERLRAFVHSLSRPGGKAYSCVFIGTFVSHREAQTTLAEFRKREISKSFKDAFIRSL